jgi:hypothetical protein
VLNTNDIAQAAGYVILIMFVAVFVKSTSRGNKPSHDLISIVAVVEA